MEKVDAKLSRRDARLDRLVTEVCQSAAVSINAGLPPSVAIGGIQFALASVFHSFFYKESIPNAVETMRLNLEHFAELEEMADSPGKGGLN
jgi:hypothetical protein